MAMLLQNRKKRFRLKDLEQCHIIVRNSNLSSSARVVCYNRTHRPFVSPSIGLNVALYAIFGLSRIQYPR
jgi:hypothetical protein